MTSRYENERVIGHRVAANEPTPSMLRRQVLRAKRRLDMEPLIDRYILIEENDVDWDSGRQVRLSEKELREIALRFTDLEEPDE